MDDKSVKATLSQIQSGHLPPIAQSSSTMKTTSAPGLKSVNEGLGAGIRVTKYSQDPPPGTKLRIDSKTKK